MMSSYLIFQLAGRVFGARLLGALEILPRRISRPVPLSYDHVDGLIDYRGIVYPVFDFARRLGLSRPEPIGFAAKEKPQTVSGQSIILLEEQKTPFGIIVDAVEKMATLEETSAAAGKMQGIDPRYIKGVAFEGDQEITILDFERLLNAG